MTLIVATGEVYKVVKCIYIYERLSESCLLYSLYAYAVSRSGTVEAGKDAASSQPNKRFQQTQAQVDEVSGHCIC